MLRGTLTLMRYGQQGLALHVGRSFHPNLQRVAGHSRKCLHSHASPRRFHPLRARVRQRSIFSSPEEQRRFARRAVMYITGVLGLGAGAGYLVILKMEQEYAAIEAEPSGPPIEAPAEFIHPYVNKPWWWRVLFAIKRCLYLAYVFAPVSYAVAMTAMYPDSTEWRTWLVDALMSAMERAGCCFMKLGQWISMRPDMFPPDVVKAMSRLRSGVTPHSFEETKKAIKESLGYDLEDIFESFESEAIASGTVAQVHRARLKPEFAIDGKIQDVAVKVRHPHILQETYMDLDILFTFVDTFLPSRFSMPCSQDELSHILRQQLDLKWEAYNLYKFHSNFKAETKSGLINFPHVSTTLASPAVLIESWVDGSTIATLFSELQQGGKSTSWNDTKSIQDAFSDAVMEKKKQLARILFDMNVKMFLRDNYVHGDLHAGNLICSMEDGRVTVIDAGLITYLKPDATNPFGDFLRSLCSMDVDGIVKRIMQFNVGKAPVDQEAFRQRIESITEHWRNKGGSEKYALGDVVGEILLSLQHFKIVLRGDVAASIMTISISEGLILQLDPEFDLVMAALPYFVKYKGWRSAEAALRGF